MLTSDQLAGILRAFTPIVTYLITHYGFGTDANAAIMWTALTSIIVAGWSAYTNSKTAMIQSVNAADNGVKVVAATVPAPQVDAPIGKPAS